MLGYLNSIITIRLFNLNSSNAESGNLELKCLLFMIHISCIGLPPGPDKKMTKNEQKLLKEKIFRAVDRTKKDRKKNRTMV